MSAGRSLLLIGASGFVGSHLGEAAGRLGLEVVRADRDPSVGAVHCDLTDPESVAECVRTTRPDRVVNLAGSASVAESWRDPAAAFAVNAAGVLNLLEAVAAHAPEAHVLCVSSGEVYGDPGERLPFAEVDAIEPLTPYGAGKAAMETIAGQYSRSRDLAIAVVRLFNQIGPGQSDRFATSSFARQIAAAEAAAETATVLRVGNIAAARDFTDVREGAAALAAIADRGLTGTFNLCSGRPRKIEEILAAMTAASELEVEVRVDPELRRPTDPELLYGDPSRLEEAIGWSAETPPERSVADLLEWWRERLAGTSPGPPQ